MAAEIKPATNVQNDRFSNVGKKPDLISKLEGCLDDVSAAVFVPGEDAVITASKDRYVRVWLRRDSGQYYPSICHTMPAAPTTIEYLRPAATLFIGCENGLIEQFEMGHDYNQMQPVNRFGNHESVISGLAYSVANLWIISTSHDKIFQYHCTQSGRRIGSYIGESWLTALQYDIGTNHAFVGDYNGQITMFHLEVKGLKIVTTLKRHEGSIQALYWCPKQRYLFSGGFDRIIIVWDIGGNQGVTYQLHGHHNKITGLKYSHQHKFLLSAGKDCVVAAWDMQKPRYPEPEWREGNNCELCNKPFFWNIKAMWNSKKLEVSRQHHCRSCGAAVCDGCSLSRLALPAHGFELEVRVCNKCAEKVRENSGTSTSSKETPYALFHDARHSIICMDLDPTRNLLLTAGQDHVVKLWDLSPFLN